MAFEIRRVDYFHAAVPDEPGTACELLSQLAELGVNLLAFHAIPVGPMRTQLAIFPEDELTMQKVARDAGIPLDGPHGAILVQGDDELGALARLHRRLEEANVNVYASIGVADGRGGFGYVLHVRPEESERALGALEVAAHPA